MSREALAALLPDDLRGLLRSRALALPRPVTGHGFGRHRSLRAGLGLDFRDHRAYAPGDDLRRLDWRAMARRDRLVLRQTEAEDELALTLVLDASEGMRYGEGSRQKLRVAAALAAAFAWVAATQGDPVGFAVGRDGEADVAYARAARGGDRLSALTLALQDTPRGLCPWELVIGGALPRLAPRSLVVVLSDLLDPSGTGARADDERLVRALARVRAARHDVLLLQVLHADELEFPFREREMLRFLDPLRLRPAIEGAPAALRGGYLERLHAHLSWWDEAVLREGFGFARVRTDRPLGPAFAAVVAHLSGAHAEAVP